MLIFVKLLERERFHANIELIKASYQLKGPTLGLHIYVLYTFLCMIYFSILEKEKMSNSRN